MKSSCMTTYILVAMVLGIAVGGLIHDQFCRSGHAEAVRRLYFDSAA